MTAETLYCPIRGALSVSERTADGLNYSEEKRRIDCIRFLLEKGYPAAFIQVETVLLRFGSQGRNSFRTDIAVFDMPVTSLPRSSDLMKSHIKLVAEIKRDSRNAEPTKLTQVYPAMDFLRDIDAFGIYWDDVQQRLFYRTLSGSKTRTHEVSVALLPHWGQSLGSRRLLRKGLRTTNLLKLFRQIEDGLHALMPDQAARFEVMLQLLLVKMHDEHTHTLADQEMSLQDYVDAPLTDADVIGIFDKLLSKAVQFYGKYLPHAVPKAFKVDGSSLRKISSLLAPITVFGAKREVIQDFYMYFAKGVYKWDMAQYFTPTEVVDFIVALTNPQAGDQVKDPACGSGDFLISTLHHSFRNGIDIADSVWGADNSPNAVQVSVLNMVINGDGKSNIREEDSLLNVDRTPDAFSVMLCNPPFGIRIVEQRAEVLRHFDLAHAWEETANGVEQTDRLLTSQETGILFAELCVRQAVAGGRIGIILPNGYLGNRSVKYVALREWILRHTRVVAVVGFPRFTFKKSGADVSASVLILEKRKKPLKFSSGSEKLPFYAGLLESVGWSVGDKRADRVFKRDPASGAVLVDSTNEPIVDADFSRVMAEIYASSVSTAYPWLVAGTGAKKARKSWSVSITDVLKRSDLSLDPKRWCKRVFDVRAKIAAIEHFALGDIVEVVPQERRINDPSGLFKLIEIDGISDGGATPEVCRGWQLPARARHGVKPRDVFVGSIWSSVGKWFLAGGDCATMVVTNGMHRLQLKPGKEKFLIDLVAGLSTEAYRIQARAFTTGSDGLADLPSDSLLTIVLPVVKDKKAREKVQEYTDALLEGRSTVRDAVEQLIADGRIPAVDVEGRSHHVVLV